MTDNKELKNEELQEVSGAGNANDPAKFDYVTCLLKSAGDKAWSVLGDNNEVWSDINLAEKTSSVEIRKQAITGAIISLKSMRGYLSNEDYDFLYRTLSQCNLLMSSIN